MVIFLVGPRNIEISILQFIAVSCVGLTRAQAEAFERWNCEQCRGVARVLARAETPAN